MTRVKTVRRRVGLLLATTLAMLIAEGLARAESATQVAESHPFSLFSPQELSFRVAYGYTESDSLNFYTFGPRVAYDLPDFVPAIFGNRIRLAIETTGSIISGPNHGGTGFVNVLTKDSPLNVADHGVQWVDYDHDGGLDLSVTRGYTTMGGHFLFRNALPESVKRRSLEVTVLDSKGHWTRFGAEVRLDDASGKILATRQVSTGGGYNSQSAMPVHFGLAKLQPVTVEVTFMSKQGRKKQTMKNVNPADYYGKSLIIREVN